MRRLTHLVVLLAFVFSCGGQWTAFQCIAWANMIREYSQVVPVAEALKMTFSGDYPCSMCKAIAEKKSAEQQKALALDKHDTKFFVATSSNLVLPDVSELSYADFTRLCPHRAETPPVPPPRPFLS